MAGVTLPDVTSLSSSRVQAAGGPTPEVSTEVARTPFVGAPQEAAFQLGGQVVQAGGHLQDIIDTAQVNDAMANQFQPKLRDLAQNFYSQTGKAAVDGAGAYAQGVQETMNQTAEGLTGQARRHFMSMAQPSVNSELYRAQMHAGQQAIVYANQSHEAAIGNDLVDMQGAINSGDENLAQDSVKLARTREISFMQSTGVDPNSDIGKYRLHQLDQKIQANVVDSILKMPPDRQIAIAHSFLAPESQKTASSSGSSPSSPYNLGNVKTASGAATGAMDFVNPATPKDGVILTANTLRSGYQGMTLEQIGQKWTGESADKVSAWVKNVSKASGITPDVTIDMNDSQELGSLLSGIAVAEKSPADRKNFTPDVIAQGVQASIDGQQANTTQPQAPNAGQPQQAASTSPYRSDATFMGFPIHQDTMEKITQTALANKKVYDNLQKESYENQLDAFAADPHFVSMAQVPDSIKAGFALQPKAQQYLEARAEYNLKNSGNMVNADKLQYGSGFYNLLQNVYSQNGINSVSDLHQYMGKGGILTVDGFNALKQELAQKNSPEGQAIADAKAKLFKTGAQSIYGDASSFGLSDPKGEQLHQKWMAIALNDYNAGLKAGKTPAQLLSPQSPDYVGNSISMFRRSDLERLKDQTNIGSTSPFDDIEASVKYGRASEAQAKTQVYDFIRREYGAGRITKSEAEKQAQRFGLLKPQPQVPRPE